MAEKLKKNSIIQNVKKTTLAIGVAAVMAFPGNDIKAQGTQDARQEVSRNVDALECQNARFNRLGMLMGEAYARFAIVTQRQYMSHSAVPGLSENLAKEREVRSKYWAGRTTNYASTTLSQAELDEILRKANDVMEERINIINAYIDRYERQRQNNQQNNRQSTQPPLRADV